MAWCQHYSHAEASSRSPLLCTSQPASDLKHDTSPGHVLSAYACPAACRDDRVGLPDCGPGPGRHHLHGRSFREAAALHGEPQTLYRPDDVAPAPHACDEYRGNRSCSCHIKQGMQACLSNLQRHSPLADLLQGHAHTQAVHRHRTLPSAVDVLSSALRWHGLGHSSYSVSQSPQALTPSCSCQSGH